MQTMLVLGILGALAVGVVSPGPSFVVVARTAIAMSRREGLAAAFGMGVGGVVFATVALLGLQVVLAEVGWLYGGLRLLGGLYLLYLAIRLWRGAREPLVVADMAGQRPRSLGRSFSLGLATQLSNPKTAVVYASVFAALIPPEVPAVLLVVLPPLIFVLETGWYAVVALIFSSDRPRAAYLTSKTWIDRVAGAVMGALGARIIVETVRPA
jgi:threonine/homoserine/homoserine lactone efflux protein